MNIDWRCVQYEQQGKSDEQRYLTLSTVLFTVQIIYHEEKIRKTIF